MNTELTPYVMVRTPVGFFRLATMRGEPARNQAVVTFHQVEHPGEDKTSYVDLGLSLVYELVEKPNRDWVSKSFIDVAQALVNHAGLTAQGTGLKYSHCAVQLFGPVFSTTPKTTLMYEPMTGCGGWQ